MSLGILTNVAATYAQNNLNQTQNSLQTVLQQLSSGSRINSGADDAAGLSIADGLKRERSGSDPVRTERTERCRLAADRRWRSVAGDESCWIAQSRWQRRLRTAV